MNKSNLKPFMIVFASDHDLGIRYTGSSAKGKRYFLVTSVNLEKDYFEVMYFSKNNYEREFDNRYVQLDEMPDSVLKVDTTPRKVKLSKVSHLRWETELSTKSINLIKEKRNKFGLFLGF